VKYKNVCEHQWFSYFVCFWCPRHVVFCRPNNSRDICHLDEIEDHGSNYHGQSTMNNNVRTQQSHVIRTLLEWISKDHWLYPKYVLFYLVHRILDKDRAVFESRRKSSLNDTNFECMHMSTSVPPLGTASDICDPAESGAQEIHSITFSWPRNSFLQSPFGNDQIRIV
jgi:hypothetical protein